MGILDSLMAAFGGNSGSNDASANPLGAAIGSLLSQNGGVQGLMNQFSQGGLGDVFSSWVGTGENKPISADQIQGLLGGEQVEAVASKLGVDPSQASGFLADYLPKIVDKLTPDGEVGAEANSSEGLTALLPSLLSSLGMGGQGKA